MNLRTGILWAVCAASTIVQAGVDFGREVRPILSQRCFKCHGFDADTRKAKLRLDVRDEAMKPAKSGAVPIVPRDLAKSELIHRITSDDEDEVMPPGKDHEPLKPSEIAVLKQWISEGANYEAHWSFVPPKSDSGQSIDEIVRVRLAKEGLKPSPKADEATLRRRVSLALIGLPFDPDHSLAASPQTYGQLVDSLLASPHFGERLAIDWLDLARYADTNGYYTDAERQSWPWRDWVIKAFNDNMPFDQFTIEQLAGDLLPNPTLNQKIATAFNRNHTVTNESGIIDEEYRTGYVCDRVETTAETWLGLTMGCSKCHDHKFDPLTMRDYYGMFAAFNNLDEHGIVKEVAPGSAAPSIQLPTDAQREELANLGSELKQLDAQFKAKRPVLNKEIAAWEKTSLDALPAAPSQGCLVHFDFDHDQIDHGPRQVKSSTTGKFVSAPGVKGQAAELDATQYLEFAEPVPVERDRAFSLSVWIKPGTSPQGCVASKQDSDTDARGFEILWYKAQPRVNLAHRYGSDGIEVVAKEKFANGQWRHLVVTYDGSSKAAGMKVYVDGRLSDVAVRQDSLSGSVASKEPWRVGWKGTGVGFDGSMDEFRLYDRAISADEVGALYWREFFEGIIAVEPEKRARDQSEKLESYYIAHHGSDELKHLSAELSEVRTKEEEAKRGIISLSVMQEMAKPRETHILRRGQYDQPADLVTFAVPASLGKLAADAPANRLGLARWLVSKKNPLTARVAANRLWTMCFGDGLVRTPNDFGMQGELPTNQELLDFLAMRLRDGDATTTPWNFKALLKLIVMSETFRQSSNFTPQLLSQDPENRLLARGPRFRLPAEIIRDQALAVSGLLAPKIGGPSVKPYQPPGLWEAVSYNGEASYQSDSGAATHRRGLYTFISRRGSPSGDRASSITSVSAFVPDFRQKLTLGDQSLGGLEGRGRSEWVPCLVFRSGAKRCANLTTADLRQIVLFGNLVLTFHGITDGRLPPSDEFDARPEPERVNVIPKRSVVPTVGVAALAVSLLALVVAGIVPSRSQATTIERSEEAACIAAATDLPQRLRVHFIIHRQPPRELNHRETFTPQADIKFAIAPMPDGCAGKVGRRLEVKVRFKTSLQAPMTVKGYGWGLHPSLWQAVFREDTGSGMCDCGRPQLGRDGGSWEFSRTFGRVQWVEAHARLSATDSRTGATVRQKIVAIPATFTVKPTLSNH